LPYSLKGVSTVPTAIAFFAAAVRAGAARAFSVEVRRPRLLPALTVFAAAIVALSLGTADPAAANSKYASIVVDVESGSVLHARHADSRRYPASLTKMMTLYLAFEALESGKMALDAKLPVSKRAAGQPPSKLGLSAGSTIKMEDAILALVTKSANDVAVVMAEALGGTEWEFARDMTAKARELGMGHTTFRNASGLPNSEQTTTARDMATLSVRLMKDYPHYYEYFRTGQFAYKGRTYRNHNHLLKRYEGTDGIKTGYIRASGFNLAASVVRDGRRVVAVVFGGRTSRSRDDHMVELLDRSFTQLASWGVAQPDRLPPRNPMRPSISLALATGEGTQDQSGEEGSGLGLVSRAEAARTDLTGWTVQVGAFGRYDQAQLAASAAVERLPDILNGAQVAVQPTAHGGDTLFRARLTGLQSRNTAVEACRRLERQHSTPCLVVRDGV
jgi:D-alanyl-D-alanine carboxypeptidase